MAMQKYKQAAEGDHVCRLRGSHSLCASAVPQCARVRCLRGMRSEACTMPRHSSTCAQKLLPIAICPRARARTVPVGRSKHASCQEHASCMQHALALARHSPWGLTGKGWSTHLYRQRQRWEHTPAKGGPNTPASVKTPAHSRPTRPHAPAR